MIPLTKDNVIDVQHYELYSLSVNVSYKESFIALLNKTKAHFAYEESLMAHINNDFSEHINDHKRLLNDLEFLYEGQAYSDILLADYFEELLIAHISHFDVQLTAFL